MTYERLADVDEMRAAMHELVTLLLRYPQLSRAYTLEPPRGVLLYGPLGSGDGAG